MERLSVERLKADERLIESIQRFPCLWEIHSKSFRDLVAKENAWKVVSTEVRPRVVKLQSFYVRSAHLVHYASLTVEG